MMYVPLILAKQLMIKFHAICGLAFVEVVHVELNRNGVTCLANEEKLECLK